jgi:chromosome partitioning protein
VHASADPVLPPDTDTTEPFEPEQARPKGTQDNFAERAQMAMSRLGELPQSNGVSKTRSLPRVVAIANQKGGVGKTTTTVNLGAALSELDYRVLVVDLGTSSPRCTT